MNRSRYTPSDPYSDTATGIRTPALFLLRQGDEGGRRKARHFRPTQTAALLTHDCLCGLEGPDEFGNYDLFEHSDCPIHGTVPSSTRSGGGA